VPLRSLRHPATLIALVALVVALTGSAYASGLISGKQIRNGTVTGAKLANHTITGSKLANGTISAGNLSAIVRGGLNYFNPVGASQSVNPGITAVVEAHCPSFAIPISGGYSIPGATNTTTVQVDDLEQVGNGWMAQVYNSGGSPITVTVDAICAFGP